MAKHNQLGNIGEEKAKKYLLNKGYIIRDVNWRFGHLELDIIAEKEDWLVVVEVKTRSSTFFEHPQEAVTLKKIKNIVKATNEYIIRNEWNGNVRFDIISVIPENGIYKIDHLKDAFLAPLS